MTRFLVRIGSALLPLLAVAACEAADNDQSVETLSSAEFEELHKSLLPPQALWKTIPWQTSLIKAQNMAARDGKPIFIWSMDGHPLGCT